MDCNSMNDFCKFICQYNTQISLIINAVSSIAMVSTVIVALCANKQSNKQLQSALQMQEQSKNIDLYEKRIEIIKLINQFNLDMELEEIQMLQIKIKILFNNNEEILDKFNLLKLYSLRVYEAGEDKKRFISATNKSDGYGGYVSLKDEIEAFENRLGRNNYDEGAEKPFRKFCEENICQIVNPKTNKTENVNYYDIYNRLSQNYILFFDTQKELIELMEQFIINGLQPMIKDKNKKRKKK